MLKQRQFVYVVKFVRLLLVVIWLRVIFVYKKQTWEWMFDLTLIILDYFVYKYKHREILQTSCASSNTDDRSSSSVSTLLILGTQ